MMDGDGSHPINVIPNLISIHLAGVDIVQCVRKGVPNPKLYRRVASKLFPLIALVLTGVNLTKQNCYYRLVSRNAIDNILGKTRFWKSIRFPLPPSPELSVEIFEVLSIERNSGHSKYHFWRLFSFALDVLLSLISWQRIFIWASLGGAAIIALWSVHPIFSLGFAIVACPVIFQLWQVRHQLVEEKMFISEKGGVI